MNPLNNSDIPFNTIHSRQELQYKTLHYRSQRRAYYHNCGSPQHDDRKSDPAVLVQ